LKPETSFSWKRQFPIPSIPILILKA